MDILLIEDNVHKLEKVTSVLKNHSANFSITNAQSYSEACSLLKDRDWDFVIVDMSIPSFGKGVPGGRFRQFGGQEIIRRMKRKKIDADYLILTQFTTFSDGGTNYSFEQMDTSFQQSDASHYKGMILFKFNDSSWQEELIERITGQVDD